MPLIITRGAGSAFSFGANSGKKRFAGVTYSVSSTYSSDNPPTYQYMNNSIADGSANDNQWGSANETNPYIKADLGLTKTITHIIIGYDYLGNLTGGWGVGYTENLNVDTSPDDSIYTTRTTTPTYDSTGSTNGLVKVNIGSISARYIRLTTGLSSYMCTLEFQIWGY